MSILTENYIVRSGNDGRATRVNMDLSLSFGL